MTTRCETLQPSSRPPSCSSVSPYLSSTYLPCDKCLSTDLNGLRLSNGSAEGSDIEPSSLTASAAT
ncbi:hypothetical protein PRIPAC_74091 [Pristionchus pacificus]|uniref:Uncharacterized protein n=1 Tax=Pristionchus pacificus TaxID=54126 RepID=A0A2A6BRY9_PRIPA|nr:hypothetical protein PRIPAC_74091 [Pristionchus pacificus]|eukprot:PDM68521.1 hypothetical protein PRIPAC_44023 [Pristionchus pacificus]